MAGLSLTNAPSSSSLAGWSMSLAGTGGRNPPHSSLGHCPNFTRPRSGNDAGVALRSGRDHPDHDEDLGAPDRAGPYLHARPYAGRDGRGSASAPLPPHSRGVHRQARAGARGPAVDSRPGAGGEGEACGVAGAEGREAGSRPGRRRAFRRIPRAVGVPPLREGLACYPVFVFSVGRARESTTAYVCAPESCQAWSRLAYARRFMSDKGKSGDDTTAQVPAEREWSDDVHSASNCPPDGCEKASGPVYRRVTGRIKERGHRTYAEEGMCQPGMDKCDCASLSCYRDLELLRERMQVKKYMAKQAIVRADLTEEHGVMKQTGTDEAHWSVWLRRKVLPQQIDSMFKVVP